MNANTRPIRFACLCLLLGFSSAACATQEYSFTFTNNGPEPIYVDFDTVKGFAHWVPDNFQRKLLVAPHTTSAPMHTESRTWPVWTDSPMYVSFQIYSQYRPQEADTVIALQRSGLYSTLVCTTENTPVRPTKIYGWINYWKPPGTAIPFENQCNPVSRQRVTDSHGNKFLDVLASNTTSATILVNLAYEPVGDGRTLPRARYYFHVSVPGEPEFKNDFELSSISGEDPQAGQY